MGNNGIEDILIGQNSKKEKKKGRGFLVFLILLLICALVALVGIYYNLINKKVSNKDQFLTAASKIDYKNIRNVDLLENLINRTLKNNSETETEVNFTTTVENENLKDVDVSKVVIELKGNNDIVDLKSSTDINFNYSGNKVYGMKVIFDENKAAIHADEVTDKYVALKYDSMKELLGLNINKKNIDNLLKRNKIDFTDEEVKLVSSKYAQAFVQNLTDTNFTIQENVGITKNSSTINVTGYVLKLSQAELNTSLVNVLTELKNDDNLLNKFITGESKSHVIDVNNEIIPEQNENPVVEDNIPVEEPEGGNVVEENNAERPHIDVNVAPTEPGVTVTPAEDVNFQTEQVVQGEEILSEDNVEELSEQPIEESVENQEVIPTETTPNILVQVNPETTEETEVVEEKVNYEEYLKSILAGKKIEMSLEETKKLIDRIIEDVKLLQGSGIEVKIYASQDEVEKMTITLPNSNTLDIEFLMTSVQETNVKLTYLYKGEKSGLEFLINEDKLDKILKREPNENVDLEAINGYVFEYLKNNKDANLTLKATLSFIEDETINEKIIVDFETEGTSNARLVKNNLIIKHSSDKAETQITVDNKIRFSVDPVVDSLNQENSLFIDEQPKEQQTVIIEDIKTKLKNVFESKKSNLSFIDTNTNSSVIDTNIFDQVTSLTRDDARTLIVNKVSSMMVDAQNNGRTLTIQDLQALQIEGYVVGTSITDAEATIVIGMYTFKIDTNFNLYDVE